MFVIPMYNHQTTFCLVLISSDILWNCFQILWLQLLKSTPEIYATLNTLTRQGSIHVMGGWRLMGKTSYRQDTLPSLPFQWGVIMCTIVSANIFVKKKRKREKMLNDIMLLGVKKKMKVAVAELCGLKCLNNCHPNILLFSRKTVLGPKYKSKYKNMCSSKWFFPHVLLSVVTE